MPQLDVDHQQRRPRTPSLEAVSGTAGAPRPSRFTAPSETIGDGGGEVRRRAKHRSPRRDGAGLGHAPARAAQPAPTDMGRLQTGPGGCGPPAFSVRPAPDARNAPGEAPEPAGAPKRPGGSRNRPPSPEGKRARRGLAVEGVGEHAAQCQSAANSPSMRCNHHTGRRIPGPSDRRPWSDRDAPWWGASWWMRIVRGRSPSPGSHWCR